MKLYFGTYTRRLSKGIYSADFDDQSGQITNCQLFTKEPSPTYLAFSQKGNLYSVGALGEKGGIAAYQADGTLANHVVEDGAPLCYVAVDEDRQLVYGANYHKGQVLVYRILADGSLELSDKVTHHGSGPHQNQASAHVHFADLTPDKYLVTCDLGTDQVISYTVSENGTLQPLATYQATPGSGPRHLVFHPTAKIAYLICELNSTIEVLIYDGLGQFEKMQVISTLPDGYSDFNGTAAIRISKDGRFVYASNRGHDSIAIYQTLGDASLKRLAIVQTSGKTPRDFILTPDEAHLIAVHQDSDNVTVFKRHQKTGLLTQVSQDTTIPEAVCILAR